MVIEADKGKTNFRGTNQQSVSNSSLDHDVGIKPMHASARVINETTIGGKSKTLFTALHSSVERVTVCMVLSTWTRWVIEDARN